MIQPGFELFPCQVSYGSVDKSHTNNITEVAGWTKMTATDSSAKSIMMVQRERVSRLGCRDAHRTVTANTNETGCTQRTFDGISKQFMDHCDSPNEKQLM